MKKFVVMAMIFAAAVVFAGETKAIVFGLVDINGNEFTNENIGGVTFKAWLQQGTGPSVNYNEVLTQADFDGSVMMYPDPIENPLRGVAMVDLQYFTTWGAGNILTIEMKDYNVASYCQISAQYTILDLSVEVVELGFEDLGLVGSGMPFQFSFITGGGLDAVTDLVATADTNSLTLSWSSVPEAVGYQIYSSSEPYGTFDFVTSVTSTSWQTSTAESKKFYYVTAYNSVVKKQPSTVEVIKK
jgi:hypothetical protein